jgi:hypothetical protein
MDGWFVGWMDRLIDGWMDSDNDAKFRSCLNA